MINLGSVLLLLLTGSAAAQSDLACSLNGALKASKCVCDAPWTGSTCSKLDILPKKTGQLPSYGFAPNVTSWGGNVIRGDDGTWDMWVSEMIGGCGLKSWTTNSRIIHATTSDMTQPFKLKDVALEAWAHNAAPVQAPKTHAACPRCYYLFHIGDGTLGSKTPEDCKNASSLLPLQEAAPPSNTSSLVHRSKNAAGPWEPLPAIPHSGCNNPAPAFARNGTLFVLCSSSSIWTTNDVSSASAWTLVTRIDLNDSPWTGNKPSPYLRVEDPYMYEDRNGNWHLLVHLYDYRDGCEYLSPCRCPTFSFAFRFVRRPRL